MVDLYNQIIHEAPEIPAKFLQSFLKIFKKPAIQPSWEFSDKMKKRVNKRIKEKEQQQVNIILEGLPNPIKWRFRVMGFVTAVCVFLFVFILSFLTDFFGDQISTPSKYTQVEALSFQNFRLLEAGNSVVEDAVVMGARWSKYFLLADFLGNDKPLQPYRFLYDGKKYPKLAIELPVYRRSGVLMNEELTAKNLANLKFGTISLKNLPGLAVDMLVFQVKEGNNSSLSIDTIEGTISLLSTSLYEWDETSDSVSSARTSDSKVLSKKIENKRKGLGISLAGYGKVQIEPRLEDGVVDFLYPFLFNGYSIWNPRIDQQIGVKGVYNPVTDQISFSNIDIASYEYASYPIRSQEEVMENLPTGGDYFDGGSLSEYAVGVKLNIPEVVYVVKWIEKEKFFIPALRFTVNGTGIAEVNTVYKELVDF